MRPGRRQDDAKQGKHGRCIQTGEPLKQCEPRLRSGDAPNGADATHASCLLGKRSPRIRLDGRNAHEASANRVRMMGNTMVVPGSRAPPLAMPETAAPVRSKKKPAYAHSL